MTKYSFFIIGLLFILLCSPLDIFAQDNSKDNLISLSFQDADINQAVKVLGDLTNTIIIPNDKLKGTISIVSMEKVKPETVINVLESALMIRGFTIVKSGEALKIVPLSEIKQSNIEVQVGTWPGFIKDQDIVITQVMPLKYSSANSIKTELQTLIGSYGNILADERANTLIITDSSSNIKRIATIISQIDRPLPAAMQIKTFIINYADAVKIAAILNSLSKTDSDKRYPEFNELGIDDIPLEFFGEIEAYPEEETNSIVIATAAVNFPAIERLITKLDVFPPQAMIEVILMDIPLDSSPKTAADQKTPADKNSADMAMTNSDQNILQSLLNLPSDISTQGFTYRILNQKERADLLQFIIDTQKQTKVLSSPRILASNNQESSFTVGQEIPMIESSTTDLSNNVTVVNFKYQDVGIGIKITPRISLEGFVNLKINAELKDLSNKKLFDANIINKRKAEATVIVPDGHTVVLGGLMRETDTAVKNKTPIIGSIPIIGNIFNQTEKKAIKTELLIFLSPKILKSIKDLQEITRTSDEKQSFLEQAQTAQALESAEKIFLDSGTKNE